ncbi:MAG: Cof-type HAD-IIB family hydrolase [Candidatus Izemoplasmatales bacterium]
MPKIVCLDIDGTLLNEYGRITETTRVAIERLKADSHVVVIASGRTYAEIVKIVAPLALMESDRAFFIAFNGVLTVRTHPFAVMMKRMLHKEDVRAIAAELVPRGFKLHVYAENRIYLSHDIVQHLEASPDERKPVMRIHMETYDRDDAVYKILVLDDAERLDELRRTLPKAITERYSVFKSWDRLLEFVHPEGTKGAALENLYRTLRIPREDVIAIGDEENDIAMIRAAGIGIAMDNAKPGVKAAARFITLSNRHDGVAAAIARHVYDKERGNDGI